MVFAINFVEIMLPTVRLARTWLLRPLRSHREGANYLRFRKRHSLRPVLNCQITRCKCICFKHRTKNRTATLHRNILRLFFLLLSKHNVVWMFFLRYFLCVPDELIFILLCIDSTEKWIFSQCI